MRVRDPRSRSRTHPAKPGASGHRAPRELVAAIIGAEAGTGIGLLVLGSTALAPLGLAALGAAIGAGGVYIRNTLVRRWLRAQLRAAR
ncbi:MAG: hypothetical protein H0T69_16110 [Thermoleophilaceae bacterium]|nr:hypothetical protein [Thermoleophilaceae bacterium]